VRFPLHHLRQRVLWALLLIGAPLSLAQGKGVPAPPGAPITVSNQTMSARLTFSRSRPQLEIEDLETSRKVTLQELFAVTLKDGSLLSPTVMHWQERFTTKPLAASSANGPSTQTCASWSDARSSAELHWCLLLRSGDRYLRVSLQIRSASSDLPITEVRLLDFRDMQAHVAGTVKGHR